MCYGVNPIVVVQHCIWIWQLCRYLAPICRQCYLTWCRYYPVDRGGAALKVLCTTLTINNGLGSHRHSIIVTSSAHALDVKLPLSLALINLLILHSIDCMQLACLASLHSGLLLKITNGEVRKVAKLRLMELHCQVHFWDITEPWAWPFMLLRTLLERNFRFTDRVRFF